MDMMAERGKGKLDQQEVEALIRSGEMARALLLMHAGRIDQKLIDEALKAIERDHKFTSFMKRPAKAGA